MVKKKKSLLAAYGMVPLHKEHEIGETVVNLPGVFIENIILFIYRLTYFIVSKLEFCCLRAFSETYTSLYENQGW